MSNRSKRAKQFAVLGGSALVAAPMLGNSVADAATYQVTNLLDSGAGSLRDAVEAADLDAGADTITFAPGLTGTIALTTGPIEINTAMTITGPGASSITVDGGDTNRVLYLYSNSNIDVTISGLTLANGYTPNLNGGAVWADNVDLTLDAMKVIDSDAGTAYGGGVYTEGDGTLTMLGSEVSGNLTSEVSGNTAAYGAGVYIASTGAVIIRDTLISGNTASAWGGGLYFDDAVSLELTRDIITENTADGAAGASIGVIADASVTITDCTISDNVATGKPAGGIGLESPEGDVTISGTTFSGNTSADTGGGLYFASINADVLVVNSTFSGNTAGTDGGGIYFTDIPYGTFTIAHTTITGNTAVSDGGGVAFYDSGAEPLMLDHTVIAGNAAGDEGNDINTYEGDLHGDYSMIGDLDLMTLDGTTNLPEGDAMLGALADNGGHTLTHLPLDGSPLLNSGDPAFSAPPGTDQRGLSRVYAGRIDIGAVEAQPELPPTGSSSGLLAGIGAALLALGGAMHLTDRRRTRRV